MNRALILAAVSTLVALPALARDSRDAGWNQWRGPNRDGLSPDTGLLKEWPSGGPPLAWKATGIGEGYSSVSIAGDKLFTQGDVGGSSSLLCLKVADGKILWTTKLGEAGGARDPGSRGTPATDGTLVFAISQGGDLVAAEAETGKIKWQKSLQRDFGGKRPGWWWSES
ncbi:MAG TPA: PQQ-binding-like beta-propeller repeat protein, partial [Planctomycetota bacterium]|nr:PQQ-binding-like beta-propeller repeat protein [Planctomycetota bacterium]